VLNANKEVENALVSFLKAQERAERLSEAVKATRRSVDLALTQYKEGAIDFERIFNLQNVLVRQQVDLTKSEAEISLSLIEIYRALRGGWQIRLDGPTPMTASSAQPVTEGRFEAIPSVAVDTVETSDLSLQPSMRFDSWSALQRSEESIVKIASQTGGEE
jgi:hypothetical protein